jgi:uncharacterized protein YgiM (DUF1202 family)
MKGFIKRGSLRVLSFTAACLVASASCTGSSGDLYSVHAVTDVNDIRAWKQFDDRWGDIHLGKSGYNMRGSGCAATSLAFLVAKAGNFKGKDFDPGMFCRLMSQFNGFGPEGDIYWGRVSSVAPGFRFVKTEYLKEKLPYEERFEAIKKYVDEGKYVIIDVQNSGHWVAVDRIENDRIISFDPGGYRNTDVFEQYDHLGNTCIKVFESKYTVDEMPELEYNYNTGRYVTTADILNVRKHPSSSSERVGGLFNGSRVEVKGISGCWGMIIYNDATAWICLEYTVPFTGSLKENEEFVSLITEDPTVPAVTTAAEAAPAVTDTQKVTETAVITKPLVTTAAAVTTVSETTTTTAPVTTTVTTTTTTAPVTTTVMTTTTTMPVTTTVTEAAPVSETTVTEPVTTVLTEKEPEVSDLSEFRCKTNAALNFRTGPGTDNEIICVIPNGTSVTVYGEDENDRWGMTEYKGRKGWICLDYVVPEDEEITETPAVTEEPEKVSEEPENVTEEPEETTAETEPPAESEKEPVSDTAPAGAVIGTAMYGGNAIKPEPDESGILRGDVDGNGFINILDYIMLRDHFEGKKINILFEEADVNSDGSVTLSDLVAVRSMFVARK